MKYLLILLFLFSTHSFSKGALDDWLYNDEDKEIIDSFFSFSEDNWRKFIKEVKKNLPDKAVAYTKKDSRDETTLYIEHELDGTAKITLFFKDSPFYKPKNNLQPWKVETATIINSKQTIEKYNEIFVTVTNDKLHELFMKNKNFLAKDYLYQSYIIRNRKQPIMIHSIHFKKGTIPMLEVLLEGLACPPLNKLPNCIKEEQLYYE